MKKTKIICTIGPSSMSKKAIRAMHKKGMDIARINVSHGSFEQYREIIRNIRSVDDMPIIIDTQGPEVRSENEETRFNKGDVVKIGLTVPVFEKLKKGLVVLLDDGMFRARIVDVEKDSISIKMMNAGTLANHRKVVFKGVKLNLPLLTKKDEKAIRFAKKMDADFIALSYARGPNDIDELERRLGDSGIKIISKIENSEGVKNIKGIISKSYAIMVARGDLGVDIESKKVPIVQKRIVRMCNEAGKPAIVATQMMESMIKNSSPTRAETSDIANAIIDGADSLMLSGETAIGMHPIKCVDEMSKICRNTEDYMKRSKGFVPKLKDIAFYASQISGDSRIVCLTRSGYTARMVSRLKPNKEVIAITPSPKVKNLLKLSYAIHPVVFKKRDIKEAIRFCISKKLLKKDDMITLLAGMFAKNTTNTIMRFKAGDAA